MNQNIRKEYTREFKKEAVELVTKQNYTITQAAQSLGINRSMLARWRREYLGKEKGALQMAIGRRKPGSGLIHHSERGSQYACDRYRRLLEAQGIISSMSRSGKCLDNAVAERFFRTLKSGCLMNWREMPAEAVQHDIVGYIEMFYNSVRLHSSNGYLSPNDFEKRELTLV